MPLMNIEPISASNGSCVIIRTSKMEITLVEGNNGGLEITPRRPAVGFALKVYHEKGTKKSPICKNGFDLVVSDRIDVVTALVKQ